MTEKCHKKKGTETAHAMNQGTDTTKRLLSILGSPREEKRARKKALKPSKAPRARLSLAAAQMEGRQAAQDGREEARPREVEGRWRRAERGSPGLCKDLGVSQVVVGWGEGIAGGGSSGRW